MKRYTIIVEVVEHIDADFLETYTGRSSFSGRVYTVAHHTLAELFGFNVNRTPIRLHPADPKKGVASDLHAVEAWIRRRAATLKGTKVVRKSRTKWAVFRTL